MQVPVLANRKGGSKKRSKMIDRELLAKYQKKFADIVKREKIDPALVPVLAMYLGFALVDEAKEPCSCRLCIDCPEKEANLGDKLCANCSEEETWE